jgi:hypothetical protein
MERDEEIVILIEYLKNDVKRTINTYPNLISDTIIKNGKLIEAYKAELEKLKK